MLNLGCILRAPKILTRFKRRLMGTLFRSVFTLAVLLLAFGLLTEAFHLMNLPSDRTLLGGIAMIIGLVLAVPMILHMIWSKLK